MLDNEKQEGSNKIQEQINEFRESYFIFLSDEDLDLDVTTFDNKEKLNDNRDADMLQLQTFSLERP